MSAICYPERISRPQNKTRLFVTLKLDSMTSKLQLHTLFNGIEPHTITPEHEINFSC